MVWFVDATNPVVNRWNIDLDANYVSPIGLRCDIGCLLLGVFYVHKGNGCVFCGGSGDFG